MGCGGQGGVDQRPLYVEIEVNRQKRVKLDVDRFSMISFRWCRRKIFATVSVMSADRKATRPAQRATPNEAGERGLRLFR